MRLLRAALQETHWHDTCCFVRQARRKQDRQVCAQAERWDQVIRLVILERSHSPDWRSNTLKKHFLPKATFETTWKTAKTIIHNLITLSIQLFVHTYSMSQGFNFHWKAFHFHHQQFIQQKQEINHLHVPLSNTINQPGICKLVSSGQSHPCYLWHSKEGSFWRRVYELKYCLAKTGGLAVSLKEAVLKVLTVRLRVMLWKPPGEDGGKEKRCPRWFFVGHCR